MIQYNTINSKETGNQWLHPW